MNRTSFIGTIAFLLWLASVIIFLDLIVGIFENCLFNLTGFFNSIIYLDLSNVIHYGIGSIVLMFIWIPYYFLGMGLLLLMFSRDY